MYSYTTEVTIGKKKIQVLSLERIAFVKEGLSTGDNKRYIYKEKNALGNYKIIDKKLLLTDNELQTIINDEELKRNVSKNGITKNQFNGKTIVPYDKGGSSDIESARLSNYFFPTQFFIDWSTKNVTNLKTLTIADKKRFNNQTNIKKDDEKTLSAVFRNNDFYFKPGITFSITGLYSPIFKFGSGAVFDMGGNTIILQKKIQRFFSYEFILGILCSKFSKYVFKNFINNSINSTVDAVKNIPIPFVKTHQKEMIESLTNLIIKKQKKDLSYNYQEYEQLKIDQKVYEIFGLTDFLIEEVENWYNRKYPKLNIDNNVK